MNVKQVLVVRKDLNMRKGKIAAQCSHASMGVILGLMKKIINNNVAELSLSLNIEDPTYYWLNTNFKKICVYVNSESELDDVAAKAADSDIIHTMIIDSGLTEFKGVPTKTVLAVGPNLSDKIDLITGHLPLL